MIPEQWKIHDVFHVDLLTPYRETEFYGANYAQPPPDLIGEEEQYKVEQVLDERNYGRWKKKQYLVKWKGYPDSDNQWLDAKDMENAQELITEFHNSNSKLRSRIRRALGHLRNLHPLSSDLPSTISTHMSDASHSTEHSTLVTENMTPLPIPPHKATTDVPTGPVRMPISTPTTFYCVRDEDFPHPDEPTPSELNDSDQENVPPPVISPAICASSPTQAEPLGRIRASIPFTNNKAANQALLSALTRVRNNVDHGCMYQLQIEEIVRIGRALQYRRTPVKTKKQCCSLPNSTPYAPWDRSLIPLHRHHPLTSPFRHLPYCTTCKSRPVLWPPVPESTQWPTDRLRPSQLVPKDHRVQGLKLITWGLEYRLFQKVFKSELSCCLLACQEELRHRLP